MLFGAYKQVSGTSAILTLPEGSWELSLDIYLIVKAFLGAAPSSPGLSGHEQSRRVWLLQLARDNTTGALLSSGFRYPTPSSEP